MKVIKSLESGRILLKGTSQEGGFLSFLVFMYVCTYFANITNV